LLTARKKLEQNQKKIANFVSEKSLGRYPDIINENGNEEEL
jgi:hypothetical protein